MTAQSRWCRSGDLTIHYVDQPAADEISATLAPMLFVPGWSEMADEHRPFLAAFAPRRAIVVDLRGRGRSDKPPTGYSLTAQIGDVDAVIRAAGLERFHLVTYSRGSTYGLGWALDHAAEQRVLSVSIGDYLAGQIKPPIAIRDSFGRSKWRGLTMGERWPVHVPQQIVEEAVPLEWWDRLGALSSQLMVVRGGQEGALVSEAIAQRWRAARPDVELVSFHECNHDLWDPDPSRYAATVRAFIERTENSR